MLDDGMILIPHRTTLADVQRPPVVLYGFGSHKLTGEDPTLPPPANGLTNAYPYKEAGFTLSVYPAYPVKRFSHDGLLFAAYAPSHQGNNTIWAFVAPGVQSYSNL